MPPVYRDEDGYLLEDGMGRPDNHMIETSLWYLALRRYLSTATVCSDLPLHYERGDTNKTLVPDLFVALRAPPQENRLSYKLWENPLQDLVIDMLLKSTLKKDVRWKRDTYEHLGVSEYWLFDPAGHQLATPLVGYRLRADAYQPIAAGFAGLYRSEVLGLELHVRDGRLRFRDPTTGEDLRTFNESQDRADAAKKRADAMKNKADAAEKRADAMKNKADAAEKRADAAKKRADAAEREVARLRLLLEGSCR